jgi:hypothetical protein
MPKLHIDITNTGKTLLIDGANPAEVKYVLVSNGKVIGSSYHNVNPGDDESVLAFCNFTKTYTVADIHAAYETLNAIRKGYDIPGIRWGEFTNSQEVATP